MAGQEASLETDKLFAEHNLSVYKDLGFFALKTLLTLNGGAIIVLLTFVSGVINGKAAVKLDVNLFESATFAFLLGLFFCFLSVIANMLTSLWALNSPNERTGVFGFMFWLLVPAVVSFFFFVAGVLVALKAVS